MDPVSVAANVIALLSAATVTCELMVRVAGAGDSVRADLTSISALQTTLGSLHNALENLPPPITATDKLLRHLQDFLTESQDVERSMGQLGTLLAPGSRRGHRAVASVKWAVAGEKKLKAFLARALFWNTIFSNELQIVQIDMMRAIMERASETHLLVTRLPLPQPIGPTLSSARHEMPCGDVSFPGLEGCSSPKNVAARLERFCDPVGLQAVAFSWSQFPLCCLQILHGKVILAKPSLGSGPREVYEVCQRSQGYEMRLTFSCRWARSFKLVVCIYSYQKSRVQSGFWANINIRAPCIVPHHSPPFKAARGGNLGDLQKLLDARMAYITDTTPSGESLLHAAVRYNQHSVVSMLLGLGADANATNDYGVTPLHLAVRRRASIEIVKLLLECGADMARHDVLNLTPLHYSFNSTIHQLLIRSDAEIPVFSKDRNGLTPAHYVAESNESTVQDLTSILARTHMSLLETDNDGRTLLHCAAQRGNLVLIEHLLQAPNRQDGTSTVLRLLAPDKKGRTPIFYAVGTKRAARALELLAPFPPGVAARDGQGRTVLHEAAARGNVLAIRKLVEMGGATAAELTSVDSDGLTPLQLAVARGSAAAAAAADCLTLLGQDLGLGGESQDRKLSRELPAGDKARRGDVSGALVLLLAALAFLWSSGICDVLR